MRLSAPVYKLKRQAKVRARQEDIPLHEALDRVAVAEGFQSWSHLAFSFSKQGPAKDVLSRLRPGDMVLLGARPGQGKTLLGVELAAEAAGRGKPSIFFTLDYNERDVADRFADLGLDQSGNAKLVEVETSDDICADYIVSRFAEKDNGAFVVIDYLQLLDQKRTHPTLQVQVAALQAFAKAKDAIVVLISQIDRSFELAGKEMPDLSDVRLPNPVDLSLFNKTCFINNGNIRFEAAA